MKPDGECFIEVSKEGDQELRPGMIRNFRKHETDQSYCWRLLKEIKCRREWCWAVFVFAVCGAVLYLFVSFMDGKKDKPKIYNYY